MPELRCTVQTCTHNKNFYCDLDGIVVGGNSAKRAEEKDRVKHCLTRK